ncbi:TRAP transporter large permease [Bacillus sp. B15-48]|uniref:TRAP transporter large permease n=1 Tax=Bacillus sp. B15-48 TaxID=1548601 RepID=UPI00193EDB07|nr:TRAP transporter large permease [Bacillus sp. B15-48]MBM4760960.1 TRAP transporter large permease subunit [Bacillus sp. B15-48]
MNPSTIALLALVLLAILIMLRMPISFSMFIVGFLGLMILSPQPEAAFRLLSSNVWTEFSNYSLSVIPLYIFMGEIVFRAGISQYIFDAAYKWIGRFRGGMAATTILASAGFASISGSNSATAATIGTIALPELKKYKYHETLSTGAIATGGTLGTIIPPSTVLIVIAILTQQSIGDLFLASILPAVVLVGLMLLVVFLICWRKPDYGPPSTEKFTMKDRLTSTLRVAPIFALFAFVIGGLFLGWFSPTESGAFGAFGAIVITLLMRKLTWAKFKGALVSTLKTSAMIMMLMVGAIIFGRFLTMARLSFTISDFINSLQVSSIIIMLIIILIFVVGGALMDAMGFLMIAIPVFFPIVTGLGYDPVWFGIMMCVITSMGAITPPIGLNVFVVHGLTPGTSLFTIFRGTSLFLIAYILFIAIFVAFPQLMTIAL